MNERTIESDFGAAIAELSKQPLSKLFLFKSRMLGAMIDVSGLQRNGWKPVFRAGSESPVWRGCLWFGKTVDSDEGPILIQISTGMPSIPGDPDENGVRHYGPVSGNKAIRDAVLGKDGARAYLRSVGFFRETDGGLSREELAHEAPAAAIQSAECDLGEWTILNWDSFLWDLKFQTDGFSCDLPPHVFGTPFTEATSVLNGLLLDAGKNDNRYAFERLLVRLVRCISDESYDPEGWKKLQAFPDGWALWNFVHFWFAAAPHDGAAMRLLAYALGQADLLSEPYTEIGWSGFALELGPLGFFKEAVFAADRALDCPGAGETQARILWNAVVDFVRERFPGDDPEDAPVDVAWLVQILFQREEELRGMDGYWTLLGLALAANGNAGVETVAKSFEDESRSGEARAALPVRRPRDWQAFAAVFSKNIRWIRRALGAFPDPVLSREWTKATIRQEGLTGMFDPDFLDPVLELEKKDGGFVVDASPWIEKARPASADEWHWLAVPEVVPHAKGFAVATRMLVYREPGAEIELFHVEASCDPEDPDRTTVRRVLPLAKPGTKNIVAAAWEYFPYDDYCCGEIRFRVEGTESSLAAASVYFATDRHYMPRGVPFPAYVYALPLAIRRAKPIPPATTPEGKTVVIDGSRFMFEHPSEDSRALYEFHGEVVSVRTSKVSAGGEVLCLELNVGDAKLPCALPVYVRENMIEGAPVKPGDVLDGCLFLQVDFFPPDAHSKEWLDAHPDGPGPEPGADEDELVRGHPVSFRKRSPDGKMRIPVLGEGPGKTTEIDDPTPTPESFDAVDAAFRYLRDSPGYEGIVRWSPNPEGIDFAARVNGRVERYRVVKAIGDGEAETGPDAVSGGIQPLVVRLRDAGKQWKVEYEGFPEEEKGAQE